MISIAQKGGGGDETTHVAARPKEEVAFPTEVPAARHRVAALAAEPEVDIPPLNAASSWPALRGVLQHTFQLAPQYGLVWRQRGARLLVRATWTLSVV